MIRWLDENTEILDGVSSSQANHTVVQSKGFPSSHRMTDYVSVRGPAPVILLTEHFSGAVAMSDDGKAARMALLKHARGLIK